MCRCSSALFRSRDFQNDETELVVIVTPYLVDPTDPQGFRDPDRGYRHGDGRAHDPVRQAERRLRRAGLGGGKVACAVNGASGFIID